MSQDTATEKKSKKLGRDPEEQLSVTQHFLGVDGEQLPYEAHAATLTLHGENGEARASVFHVAYLAKPPQAGETSERPVSFVFNGGPGSSSVWLHLGALGPRRVVTNDGGPLQPPPYELSDNEFCLLPETDLVFIDPVGTGYSRAAGKARQKDFSSIDKDAKSIADFIERWLTKHGRWASRKFLIGESYGTMRAAAVSEVLMERGISLNGMVMVSTVLDLHTLEFESGNDLPHVLYLPSYAAVAVRHGAVPAPTDLDAFLKEAREYAIGPYARALLLGKNLSSEERASVLSNLNRFTGLDEAWLDRAELRIDLARFLAELLRARRLVIGRLDARYMQHDLDGLVDKPEDDASFTAPYPPYASLINDYLRRELGFETDERYRVIDFDVNSKWSWKQKGRHGYPSTAKQMRRTLMHQPNLQVLFLSGLYDLATPFFASEYAVAQLGREAHLANNLTQTTYTAGHMMYLHEDSMRQMHQDIVALYQRCAQVTDTPTADSA